MPLLPGLCAAFHHDVTDEDTAAALGSGDVPALGTPRALALVERAAVTAVAGELSGDQTTVGVRVELDHLAACAVGDRVQVEAELVEVVDRQLVFVVRLHAHDELAASGRLTRVLVERPSFLARLQRSST